MPYDTNRVRGATTVVQTVSPSVEKKKSLPYLSDELLVKILGYLSPSDLLKASRVCRRWHRISAHPPLRSLFATVAFRASSTTSYFSSTQEQINILNLAMREQHSPEFAQSIALATELQEAKYLPYPSYRLWAMEQICQRYAKKVPNMLKVIVGDLFDCKEKWEIMGAIHLDIDMLAEMMRNLPEQERMEAVFAVAHFRKPEEQAVLLSLLPEGQQVIICMRLCTAIADWQKPRDLASLLHSPAFNPQTTRALAQQICEQGILEDTPYKHLWRFMSSCSKSAYVLYAQVLMATGEDRYTLDIMKKHLSREGNDFILERKIDAYLGTTDEEEKQEIADEMMGALKEKIATLPEPRRSRALTELTLRLAINRPDKAEEFFLLIPDGPIRWEVVPRIVQKLVQAERDSDAEACINRMPEGEYKWRAIGEMWSERVHRKVHAEPTIFGIQTYMQHTVLPQLSGLSEVALSKVIVTIIQSHIPRKKSDSNEHYNIKLALCRALAQQELPRDKGWSCITMAEYLVSENPQFLTWCEQNLLSKIAEEGGAKRFAQERVEWRMKQAPSFKPKEFQPRASHLELVRRLDVLI